MKYVFYTIKNFLIIIKENISLIFLISLLYSILYSTWIIIEWMKNPRFFPVSNFIVTGKYYFTDNIDIYNVITKNKEISSFIEYNINCLKNNFKKMSWIKYVIIYRQWPDTIRIYFVENIATVKWNKYYFLDVNGNVFKIPHKKTKNLSIPELYGTVGSEKNVLFYFYFMKKILNLINLDIKLFNMNNRFSWKVILSDDTLIKLSHKDIMIRLKRFIKMYPVIKKKEKIINKQIKYVDLRYDYGIAVGWKDNAES